MNWRFGNEHDRSANTDASDKSPESEIAALENNDLHHEKSVFEDFCRARQYCHMPQSHDELPFQIDHIIAQKHRGPSTAANLALACFSCNSHKGPNIAGLDPLTGKLTALFHPLRHHWDRHFRWDGPILIGRTAIGRTTIVVLEINQLHRVALRQTVIDEGLIQLG